MFVFPKDFLWGASLSAYQAEGGNANSDWWAWEKESGLEQSGQACRHYELFEQDFDLAKGLNHNCHRLSLEWARIQPQPDKFSSRELEHYQKVILALRKRGIEPVVTLHHFTNPAWFTRQGGWEKKALVKYYLEYVKFVVSGLADNVRYWITINEPLVYVYHAYMLGAWVPQKKSVLSAQRARANLTFAHIQAYALMQAIYETKNIARPMISIAKNMQYFRPCIGTFRNKLAARMRDYVFNFSLLDELHRAKTLDFIGINYYSHSLVELSGWGIRNFAMDTCKKGHSQLRRNSLGWDIYPEGLYELLVRLKKYRLGLFICENGICTDDDNLRWEFIATHLGAIGQAIQSGAKIIGYLYWSLIDNFEWDKGFGPRFGLIDVDYSTFGRTIRDSARRFSQVCKSGILEG